MQTSPAIEQIKTFNGPRVRGISPVGLQSGLQVSSYDLCHLAQHTDTQTAFDWLYY